MNKPTITDDDIKAVRTVDLIRRLERSGSKASQKDAALFNDIKAKFNSGATLTKEERRFLYELAYALGLLQDSELPQSVRIEKARSEVSRYKWME